MINLFAGCRRGRTVSPASSPLPPAPSILLLLGDEPIRPA
jgi:hypothetical protein